MISQAQKIDCRAFVGEIYFRFFRNRLIQQNHICDPPGRKRQEPFVWLFYNFSLDQDKGRVEGRLNHP